jgi:hypothetical protein
MKLTALALLIMDSLVADQAHAEDVVAQPLTRVQCDEAGMTWDENANVCAANSGDRSRQPLTRLDCIEAGMTWNDNANVCGTAHAAQTAPVGQPLTRNECNLAGVTWNDTANICGEAAGSAAQAATPDPSPVVSAVLINIDKATQKMTVFLDGVQQYEWPVSPRMAARANAATLFALVEQNGLENTQVVLTGTTLGVEGKVELVRPAPNIDTVARPGASNPMPSYDGGAASSGACLDVDKLDRSTHVCC